MRNRPVEQDAQSAPLDPRQCSMVLVEDDPLLRELLDLAIRQHFAPRAYASFSEGRKALQSCLQNAPELLLTDIGLPDLSGRELICQIQSRGLPTRILVLTGLVDGVLPSEMLSLGVAGFVDKEHPLQTLVWAIQHVLNGGMFFSANVQPTTRRPWAHASGGAAVLETLTPRERDVAALVAGGYSAKEIGLRLGLSARTVERIRADTIGKSGERNLAGFVRWCVEHGIT